MRQADGYQEKYQIIGYALLIFPAVFLGMLAMACGGISPALWGQQIAAWGVLALLAWPLRQAALRISAEVWSIALLCFLAVTLLGQEAGGARRWVNLLVFHVNAAQLVLPALLVVLWRVKHPCPALLSAALVLCFQPDLSQLTALCAAAVPMLWRREKKQLWAGLLILGLLAIRCVGLPVTLEPETYCEGILAMLGERGWLLRVAGWAALAAVPAFWAIRFGRGRESQALSLFAYYAVSLLFALSENYPVLFMGFGLSPIAGYYLAYVCSAAEAKKRI